MTSWKNAGLWLAVFACVGGVGWVLGERDGVPSRAAVDARQDMLPAPMLRLAQGTTPQPIALNAAMARDALRDGELRIALPDGRSYPVRMERQDTDGTGHWNVVGRVQTALGPQAMVLTFGPDAVFGVVPLPDGRLMQITTGPGGKVSIAPAGGTVPSNLRDAGEPAPDFIVAPGATPAPPEREGGDPADNARGLVADQSLPFAGIPTPAATNAVVARAAPGTSLVTIDVLAFYAPDLVTLRGTVEAAKTEIAHLFAVANQAHIDSGSRVRLNAVATLPLEESTTDNNSVLLERMATGGAPVDIEALRDTHSADLVTLIRPYHENDGSCGIAYLTGFDLQRNHGLEPRYGYSVVDVAPCGPYVLAHELGHLLGSTHDRRTVSDNNGVLRYGAYPYAFGNRTSKFATVMAYEKLQPEVGYFSNPLSVACGDYCGVEQRSDNVQSFARMAEAIAAYRGPTGTASIAPTERLEPVGGSSTTMFAAVRLSMPAPANGLDFTFQVAGGTATQGTDYRFHGATARVEAGGRTAWFPIEVVGDDAAEGDETIVLRVVPPAGTPVAVDTATLVIADDDPRLLVQGKLAFPDGATLPTSPIDVELRNIDGDEYGSTVLVRAQPPAFGFLVPVASGSPMRLEARVPGPFVADAMVINEVSSARVLEVPVLRGLLVGGRLRFPAGATPPASVAMSLMESKHNDPRYYSVDLVGPDYAWARWISPGADLRFETGGMDAGAVALQPWAAQYLRVQQEMALDVALSTKPTAYLWGFNFLAEGSQTGLVVQLTAPAPAGGVSLHYTTLDGTAKVHEDYAPSSGTLTIPEGQRSAYIDLHVLDDERFEPQEYLTLVIDNVVGAVASVSSMRIEIQGDRRTGSPQAPVR